MSSLSIVGILVSLKQFHSVMNSAAKTEHGRLLNVVETMGCLDQNERQSVLDLFYTYTSAGLEQGNEECSPS